MMNSENKRQLARTQGKFVDKWDVVPTRRKGVRNKGHDDVEKNDSADNQEQSDSPNTSSESITKTKRQRPRLLGGFQENDSGNSRSSEEVASTFTYVENGQRFDMLEKPQGPTVISSPGVHILSQTDIGESRIFYKPNFIPAKEGKKLLENLIDNVKWHDKKIVIRGNEYPQPRLVAWFGPLPYTYSGVTLKAKEFPDIIMKIKHDVEKALKAEDINVELNSVLLNLYRDGKDSVAWHSDDEISMGICPTIASVSLGEVRRFDMRRKTPDRSKQPDYTVHLGHGSLIVMDGVMQADWEHQVPKEYHDRGQRVNLTFRTVYPLERDSESHRTLNYPKFSSSPESNKSKEVIKPYAYHEEAFPSLSSSENVQADNKSQRSFNVALDKYPCNNTDNTSIKQNLHEQTEHIKTKNSEKYCNFGNNGVETKDSEKSHNFKNSEVKTENSEAYKNFGSNENAVNYNNKRNWGDDQDYALDDSSAKEEYHSCGNGENTINCNDGETWYASNTDYVGKDTSAEGSIAPSVDYKNTGQVCNNTLPEYSVQCGNQRPPDALPHDYNNFTSVESDNLYHKDFITDNVHKVYDHIVTNYKKIPFSQRDKEELDVLLPIVENSADLSDDILVLITDRMKKIIMDARNPKSSQNGYSNYSVKHGEGSRSSSHKSYPSHNEDRSFNTDSSRYQDKPNRFRTGGNRSRSYYNQTWSNSYNNRKSYDNSRHSENSRNGHTDDTHYDRQTYKRNPSYRERNAPKDYQNHKEYQKPNNRYFHQRREEYFTNESENTDEKTEKRQQNSKDTIVSVNNEGTWDDIDQGNNS